MPQCEINVDECANNKDCGQNGQCIDGTNSFSCQCRPGFSGPLCITELDQCVKNPCNHGSCRTEDGRAVCSCSDDFTGRHCTVKRSSKCENKPCSDNTTLSCTDTGVLLSIEKFIVSFRMVHDVNAKWASMVTSVRNLSPKRCVLLCLVSTEEPVFLTPMEQLNVRVHPITEANSVRT